MEGRLAGQQPGAERTARLVTLHSLTWLAAGNAVGLWLATLLLFPQLGRVLAPLTYGRWMPVHFNLQLYGWASLPMVGLLLKIYQPTTGRALAGRSDAGPARTNVLAHIAVSLWSGCLLFGAVSWLAGHSSGKLFLEWVGPSRGMLFASLSFLAVALWIGFVGQISEVRQPEARRANGSWIKTKPWSLAGKGTLLIALSVVPWMLFWAASPSVYPPINPESGGPTGGSLLGSALGIVAVIFLYPFLAGLRPADGGRLAQWTAVAWIVHFAGFATLDHGNHSHYEVLQVVSLASIAVWWPLLVRHLRRFPLPEVGPAWLTAFAGWGALLVATGVGAFLPGFLEHVKFTNALVAHAHIAMGGLVTCFDVLLLEGLNRHTPLQGLFRDRPAFLLWHGGALLLATSLVILGLLEGFRPGLMFGADPWVTVLYSSRWFGGAAMFAASVRWLSKALAVAHPGEESAAVWPLGEAEASAAS